jgi:hypothetical protein
MEFSFTGVRAVRFATYNNLAMKSTMITHGDTHKFTWTSPDWKTYNKSSFLLIDRRRHSSALDVRSFRAADCGTDHYLVVAKLGIG